MRDEHLIYIELPENKLKVVPEESYRMLCTLTGSFLSEAIITEAQAKYFVSRANGS